VIAVIDLDQVAQTRAEIPRPEDLRRALFAWNRQAGGGHQVSNRLSSKRLSMALTQLLSPKRRPEVRIAFTDDGQCVVG